MKSPSQIIETNCSDIYYIDLFNINYYYCLKYPYTDSIEEFSSKNKYIKLTFLGKDLMVAFNYESLDFLRKMKKKNLFLFKHFLILTFILIKKVIFFILMNNFI